MFRKERRGSLPLGNIKSEEKNREKKGQGPEAGLFLAPVD